MRQTTAIAVLLLVGASLSSSVRQGGANRQDRAGGPYDVELFAKDLMVSARDGVKLATDVYGPVRDGKPLDEELPVLVQRTPYNKDSVAERAKGFASHGYIVLVQDVRGRFKSEGVFTKYAEDDGPDGYDTVQWAAALPHSDGRVGMWGTSYMAHVQADAAKMRPPALKTIVPTMGGISNGWAVKIRNHGAWELAQQLEWAWRELPQESADPVVRDLFKRETYEHWVMAMPLRKGLSPLAVAPNFEDFLLAQMTKGDYGYWKGRSVNWKEYYGETADVPMLHVGGWYDSYCASTIENYVGLARLKKSPIRLLMGVWEHARNTQSFAGEVEFGPEAAIADFDLEFHLRWFDHYLKGKSTGVEKMPPVRLFVMGTGDGHKDPNGKLYHGGYWRDEPAWPLPGTTFTKYYFHPDGTLSLIAPPRGVPPTIYRYDPQDPVLTIGGAFTSGAPRGAYDQREREGLVGAKPPYLPLRARPDVVVFQTEPLAQDVEVIGPIAVNLFGASTAPDTDFTVKLVDVYPPSRDFPAGFDMNITDGIIRARYRNSPDKQELMTPGEVYKFVIEPFPTANVFKKGHRIRIDISSSNFPRWDLNPNTGEPLGMHRRTVPADNSVYYDANYASHVVLPIAPARNRVTGH